MADRLSLPPAVQELIETPVVSLENSPEAFAFVWQQYAAQVRAEAPYAIVEDGGETIYTGALSPGCQACKAGAWDCLFLTPRCNLACPFCCSPSLNSASVPLSAMGREVDEIVANFHLSQPAGISFSGGEIFLEFERLWALVDRFRREFPRAYLWVYTNGLLASGGRLSDLGELGIDEIRFNMAATGYTNPGVLRHVYQAIRNIPNVTVEIPVIPEDENKLLPALDIWADMGVRYLNLHELMYEPGTNSAGLAGKRANLRTPDGHLTAFHPNSRALTLKVMQAVHDRELLMSVNDCSMQNKLRQLRGRRNLLARLIERKPGSSETLNGDGFLETICGFSPEGEHYFFRPGYLDAARKTYPGFRFIRLRRAAPLSLYEKKRWELVEELENG